MVSERASGPKPTFIQYRDEYQEVQGVLAEVNDLENTAILARTNRQLLRFQKECMRRNTKAEILGHKNLWQENEVKHLMEVAKDEGNMSAPAAQALTEIIRDHNMVHRYVGTGNPNDKDPVENLNDIVRMAGGKNKDTGELKTLAEFLDWFSKITYMRKSKKDPILALSTVHQAKGREWKHVFLVGCKQGTMPHKDGEITEEARIFFVACSRAADTLAVSFYGSRSQFLNNVRNQIEVYDEGL
jgi:superfamily I DNA/RNA helicase